MKRKVHSIEEFRHRFNSNRSCLDYLLKLRWPTGFVCPHCRSRKYWTIKLPFGYECSCCGLRTSPTAGTAFHRSHITLKDWFLAIYLSSQPDGISAGKLSCEIKCSHRTAFRILRIARKAMASVPCPMLTGGVDAGQCVLQCLKGNSRETTLAFVFCAAEEPIYTRKPYKRERISLSVEAEANEDSVISFLNKTVAKGSELLVQDWNCYSDAIYKYYSPSKWTDASTTLTSIALKELKIWLGSTYRRVELERLQSYLDEYTFHYNRQFSPEIAFHDLLSAFCKPKE